MASTRIVSLGHLTMLDVAPPELVTLAAAAGFDAVGVRPTPASATEEPWPMRPGSPLLKQTRQRLDDTGLQAIDVEIIRMAPDTVPSGHLALLETGQALGARVVNVIAFDPDLSRVADTFAALVAVAVPFGLRPMLEPMRYSSVRNLEAAMSIVEGSGGGLIVDPLHLRRFGGSPADLSTLDPALLFYYQLCDAPLAPPCGLHRPQRLPRNQPPDVDDAALEARTARLLPGDGELPLREIIDAMPADVPISVEAPNEVLLGRIGPAEYAKRARLAVATVLNGAAVGARRTEPQ